MKRNRVPREGIWQIGAVAIVDAAHFTETVLQRGIAAALRDIVAIRRILVPVMRSHDGEVYKIDADNLYVHFDSVRDAVAAAAASHDALAAAGRRRKNPLGVSIGIGFGRLFYLPSEDDYYGAEVNLASKLGEDLARSGETLLTESAVLALAKSGARAPLATRSVSISGVRVRFAVWRSPE